MVILVTNDDGFHSRGLQTLASALAEMGKVVIVAPEREMSAVSHQLSLHHPLRITELRENAFLIDGTPSDCVYLGAIEILDEKPDLVISGINVGGNLGDDISYSGTVAAALEATILNIPAFAISQLGKNGRYDFSSAATLAVSLARKISQSGLPGGTFLNVNVPASKPIGIEITSQGRRNYDQSVEKRMDPRGRHYYWIGGDETVQPDQPGTDLDALSRGMITITPLQLDMTSLEGKKTLSGWNNTLKFQD